MVWPGQALTDKVGELTLFELRFSAQQALGNKFDIRAFHAKVLKEGSLPLALVEATIDNWVKAQTKNR